MSIWKNMSGTAMQFANMGGGSGSAVTIDDALSSMSENPVQNKVIKAALDSIGGVGRGHIAPIRSVYSLSGGIISGESLGGFATYCGGITMLSLNWAQSTSLSIGTGEKTIATLSTSNSDYVKILSALWGSVSIVSDLTSDPEDIRGLEATLNTSGKITLLNWRGSLGKTVTIPAGDQITMQFIFANKYGE